MAEENKCKHCAMTIPGDAKICPYCQKKQGLSAAAGCMVVIIGFVVITAIIGAIIGNDAPSISNAPASKNISNPPNPVTASSWEYGSSKDEMNGKVSKHATNKSVNTVNFEFPYQGEQHGSIMVTDGNQVLFFIEKGQVICHGGSRYGTCRVRVKFDDEKEKYVNAEKIGDDSRAVVFTDRSFLKKIKKSRKLMIQAEVYHNGLPIFTFDVKNLRQK